MTHIVQTQICITCLEKNPQWTQGDVIGLAYCEHCWAYVTVYTGYQEKLDSLPAKDQQSIEQGQPIRWLYVEELKDLLDNLPGAWVVRPNPLGNLRIEDQDGKMVGVLNFRFNKIYWATPDGGGEKSTPVSQGRRPHTV